MAAKNELKKPKKQESFKIGIEYQPVVGLKSTMISGALSSTTPDRMINLVCYTERRAFPKTTSLSVSPEDVIEGEDEGSEGMVRELQYSLLLNEDSAEDLIGALEYGLELLRKSKP